MRGEKRPLYGKKSMSDGAECYVVVKTAPSSPFVMIESDFFFHFLIVALDAPTKFYNPC